MRSMLYFQENAMNVESEIVLDVLLTKLKSAKVNVTRTIAQTVLRNVLNVKIGYAMNVEISMNVCFVNRFFVGGVVQTVHVMDAWTLKFFYNIKLHHFVLE